MANAKLPQRGSIYPLKRNGRPTGKWAWEYEVPGEAKRPRTRRTYNSKREAEQARHEAAMHELATRAAPKRSQTVKQYGDWWLQYHRTDRVKQSTLSDYTYRLERWIYPTFRSQQLGAVTEYAVSQWMSEMRARGLAVTTINGARRVLQMVMDHAQKSGVIGLNPVALVPPLKGQYGEQTQKREPWSAHEARAALRALESKPAELVVLLGLSLGLRRGEALALRWSDISLTEGTLRVARTYSRVTIYEGGKRRSVGRFDTPKTVSSARVLPLPEVLRVALGRQATRQAEQRVQAGDRWVEQDLLITSSVGGPLDPSAVRRQYESALSRAGLRYIRLHDLRHTAATLALQAGEPIDLVSQALGHSDVRMTKSIYAPNVPNYNARFGLALDALLQEPDEVGALMGDDLDREWQKLQPAVASGSET